MLQQFLIILTESVENVAETLNELFETVMKVGLLQVNILVKDKTMAWSLYSYKPYVRSCHSFEVNKLETFPAGKEVDLPLNELFPSMLLKFSNCPLLISAFSFMPFVIVKQFKGTVAYSGIDVTIVETVANTLNLKPVYIEPPDKRNRGRILDNGTVTGAMKMVNLLSKYQFECAFFAEDFDISCI